MQYACARSVNNDRINPCNSVDRSPLPADANASLPTPSDVDSITSDREPQPVMAQPLYSKSGHEFDVFSASSLPGR